MFVAGAREFDHSVVLAELSLNNQTNIYLSKPIQAEPKEITQAERCDL